MLSADIDRNREAQPENHIHRIRSLYWTKYHYLKKIVPLNLSNQVKKR